MKITATVQARMGSTRLPGKVLKPILGRPMLSLQIERIQRSILIDEIIIATTVDPRDDPIEQLAVEMKVACFRGSEDDVLGRVVGALKEHKVEVHVEFQGDNPMPDPMLIDSIIGFYLKNSDRYDYVTNAMKTTYPPGMEIYVYPPETLYDADRKVTYPALREHVASSIELYPGRYRLCNLEAPPWFHYPDLHLEVDTQEDLEVVSAIYKHLYPVNPGFGLGHVIDFANAHPELVQQNAHVERRWKIFRQEARG